MANKSKRRANYSTKQAIALHAEANKSDPFASRRIAMTIARDGYKEAQEIATESKRILDARDAATRKAYAEWLKSEQRAEVVVHMGDATHGAVAVAA